MKVLNKIGRVITFAFVIFAVCIMIFTIVSVTTFNKTDRSIFGYKAFIVLSDSMKKTDFEAGDLVLVKEVDPDTLVEGDIVSYTSQDESNFGEVITHKIRKLTFDSEGNPGFVTYGTSTDTDDENVVTYPYVIGKYQTHIPKAGKFFRFLKTIKGYFICIFLPFMILIIMEAIRCVRLFRLYKAEQIEQLEEEKRKIEAEREETQRMMKEILKMKAQMGELTENKTEE